MEKSESAQQVRRPRRGWLILLAAGLVSAGTLLIGFVSFASHVDNYVLPDPEVRADGIVVLTGGVARLGPAAELLRTNRGGRLLVSGVNENTSAETMKNLLLLDDAVFDCCVDLDRASLDTVGNARAALEWAQSNQFESLFWVTNDYHMLRSLLEFDRIGGGMITVTPFAVSNTTQPSAGLSAMADRYRVLVREYAKYLVALVRTPQVRQTFNALFRVG
ncbi:MAG: YdcF family protein [Pseudomonadota bacterium]